jgi:alginate O-acetyltransferase complex protein AlgI
MLFTDPCFLFLFLPILLGAYLVTPRRFKNLTLLIASVLFYSLSEGLSTFIVVFSIIFNFFVGVAIENAGDREKARGPLVFGIVVNLLLLCTFKYIHFLVANLDVVLAAVHLPLWSPPVIRLPLGISFFTFHALSYITDVWRQEVKPMKRIRDFALYIMLFPQLIAGPIIRYKIICDQFEIGGPTGRRQSWDLFAEGVRRFIIGYGKKMLISNTVAQTADLIFNSRPEILSPATAWLGVVCYTLHIYFDFSGYSDMAIGLGKMFGFNFPENFNYPYIASNITDFWRRWHMTLSSWFRDYVYIPLGGNRVPKWRVYLNLLIVFFLCGLWHGPQWTFVMWGLFHGTFLIIERVALGDFIHRRTFLRHVYVLAVVMVGWVFFRANTLSDALTFLARMAWLPSAKPAIFTLQASFNRTAGVAIVAGIIGSMPVAPLVSRWIDRGVSALKGSAAGIGEFVASLAEMGAMAFIFIASAAFSASNTYNPFIYFRF